MVVAVVVVVVVVGELLVLVVVVVAGGCCGGVVVAGVAAEPLFLFFFFLFCFAGCDVVVLFVDEEVVALFSINSNNSSIECFPTFFCAAAVDVALVTCNVSTS